MKHKNIILWVSLSVLLLGLVIEPLSASLPYEVKRGDTLWHIARSYDLSVEDLVSFNPNLHGEYLQIGQLIYIPSSFHYHVVKEGETLWSISRLFNLSFVSLMEANELTYDSMIRVGERLLIPLRGQETTSQYTVRPEDTYWSLAVRHKTSVDYLMRLNHMVPPERLQIGSVIRLPLATSSMKKEHVVRWGDTLYRLSQLYGTRVEELLYFNGLRNPEELQVGQILVVEM